MPHDLPTKLNYYNHSGDPSPYNHVGKSVDATIADITGREDKFTLENDGFVLTRQVTKVTDFLDEENVKAHYYRACRAHEESVSILPLEKIPHCNP
jgi:hypothetical protein